MSVTDYTKAYYEEVIAVARGIDQAEVDKMVDILVGVRSGGGRLFIIGVGGGAGHAGHAVNDFRKICGIESYTPTDNMSELTDRINDDGWATAFANWLRGSRINKKDALLVFSVGGGNAEKNISANIVGSAQAREVGRCQDHRRGRPRRRLYHAGFRCLRRCADGQLSDGDSTHRSLPGGGVAWDSESSETPG